MRVSHLAGLIIFTGICGLMWSHLSFESKVTPSGLAASEPSKPAPPMPDASSAPATLQASDKTKDTPVLKLGQAFYQTTNMRDFIHLARQHPEQGGSFYAYRALMECAGRNQFVRQPQYDGKQDPAKFARQQEVATRNHMLCANLLESDWSEENRKVLEAELERSYDVCIVGKKS